MDKTTIKDLGVPLTLAEVNASLDRADAAEEQAKKVGQTLSNERLELHRVLQSVLGLLDDDHVVYSEEQIATMTPSDASALSAASEAIATVAGLVGSLSPHARRILLQKIGIRK